MILFLLKSSACLAIFMLFYKLCLEKTSAHTFKRFYLIIVILISIGIPFITITEYVEVQPLTTTFTPEFNTVMTVDMIETKSFKDYLPSILWSIYMLGVVLFSLRFFKNLYQLFQTIKKNPKFKNQNFINVLLKDLIHPHTFFNYIFLNKTHYENNQIPKEVLLHEQAHAKQKHALDILCIEILQILFWFNPLLYLIKKDIKLNHEFLADQAVINKGTNTKHYQKLLLAFSSNASHNQLANAINYSLIKKRFTVMKTKTSKTSIWIRSLLLLPLLAITLYSFSEKKQVEKENSAFIKEETPQILLPQETGKNTLSEIDKELEAFKNLKINYPENSNLKKEPVLEILFNPDIYKLNGKTTSLFALKNDFIKVTNKQKSDLRIKAKGSVKMSLITKIMLELKGHLIKIKLDETVQIIEDRPVNQTQEKATPEQMAEYNRLAKYYNNQRQNKRIIKLKDVKRLEYLYSLMSKQQKASAEPFPNFPPPPPAPPIIKKGEISNIPPPPVAPIVRKGKVLDIPAPPSPPEPQSPLDYVIEIAKKGAIFYYDDKKISSDKAIDLLKNNKSLNISSKKKDGIHVVKIQTEPILH